MDITQETVTYLEFKNEKGMGQKNNLLQVH